MVTENGQSEGNTSFLRASRNGQLDKVLEFLKSNIDINTSNANGLNALHLASKDGHVEIVEELLKRGAVVDAATKKGNTALHIASLAGQEEVVKILVQHGASVNVQSQNGFTPLYMAAQENHDNVVKYLLANGANQSLSTEDGFTPLAVAMQQGHDKVVAVLLENDTRGRIRLPALHIAAKKDDVKAAKLLLENDHNADVTSKSGFTPLHIASHYGNQQIANLLIQKGADVNYAAKHNITPVHVAAKWGKANMVALLLEHGAIIDAKTRDGLTPLHCAARSGHEQVVDMLLERGAPISSKTKNGLAPLHMAAQGDHVDAARILLYHRAPVDEVTVDYLTALHVAAHCGHVRVAKLLLDRQADANARALNGFTPLHIACKKNRIKVVELLLKHGANISATTESGLTPLHVASFMGCMNIAIYLLQHEANPNVPTVRGETPLHLAARANQTDIIRILLRNGAQVDVRAREQQTPLHIASRLGNVDIVMLLLQHGAKVDSATKDMYTALHIAAKEDQDEVAAILIDNGATLNAVTKKGFTPLHLAAKYGHLKVAKLLLQKETPVDSQGKNGVTPLHIALHYDKQDVALFLLDKGASPHTVAKNGHTPLHIAARKNQMDIAHTLLEYEANPDAESKAGFVPLHLSAQEGHAEMSSLILEHKADVNHEAKNGLTPLHLCAQEDSTEVAEVLVKYGVNVNAATKSGYTPLHIASHYDQIGMVKFLLRKGAKIEAKTSLDYTPLHHGAQQGHANVVNVLLSHQANPNAVTTNGQTPLMIAQKLGYITVIDTLKAVTNPVTSPNWNEEKYRVQAPELMHETFMSDSEEEGGEDAILVDQTYRYLTADEMKSLGDDSLPIDVTRDERMDSNRVVSSMDNNVLPPQHFEDSISPEHITQNYMEYITKCSINEHTGHEKYPIQVGFLVSFLVDARGGAMRGCRHSGVRVIVPPRCAPSPTRITCRYVRPQRTPHPPPLMEGEALASRVLELGPTGVKFLGPVIIEVPHFAALRNKEREIVILRSDNGESWKEHSVEATEDILHEVLRNNFEADDLNELEDTSSGRITRIVTQDFPQYFAVVSRVRQEVHAIGPEGGMVSSTVVPQVQAVFPEGALTKKIKVGLQAQPIDPELSAKLLGHGVAVSPVVTVEPRRRKFHKAITLTMPAPKAHSQGMINQYSGSAPTLRLLCSITGGTTRAQWEDVTGSTPLTFVNDCVSFTTTVSARFWLMDCRNISDATKMATELYKEAIHVPFMAKFVVFAKRVDPLEARLRVFCMTDDKEDKTLEQQEQFTEVAKSRDVEVLEGKQHYIEFAGNLVPITKSGEQLSFCFRAFKENRLPFSVRIKDQHAEAVSRCLFMKEPKVPKGEPPQQPICILNIVLPDDIVSDTVSLVDSDSYKKHSNISENYYYYRQDPRMADMSNLLGEDWISLANQLGLTATEMNVIKSEYPDSTAKQAQSMLRMWLSQSSKKDQMNTLENALWRIGRGDIVSQCLNDEGLEIIPRTKKEISPAYRPKKEDYERDNNETKVPTKATLEDQEGGKRNNIRDKYLAEEKEQWEEEEEEEPFDKPVAERRKKIQKRLSAERTIPASSQRREIVQEITTIKQQSLVEDKLAEVQQKVIEHEEKSKTVLSKTTTTKNDQTASSNNKEPILLGDERKMAEIAHKTAQDKVFMEGITERLNKKDLVTKHISVEDGQKSPKFSKTPPPSPADFLLKEQTYTSQDIPHIAVTQEADDEETEYLSLAEVATDIEDLEEENKPRAKKNKTLKIKLGTDDNATDQEDAEGSDDNRANYDYKSDPEVEKQFQEIEVGEEMSEESYQEKGKRAKKHSTLRKSGSFVSDMKTNENYTDEEIFDTDNELQLGEEPESNFNVKSYDVAVTNMRESSFDADDKKSGLRVSNYKGYLSAHSISPNLSDFTDVEVIHSDAEEDEEVKKTNKVKRKKRKNLPERSYTDEEVELSDEETLIKRSPRQRTSNKFKSISLHYSSDNEENYLVFPITKKVAEKGTILNIPDFKTNCPTDVEDFMSPTEESSAFRSESLSDAEFEKEMKQVTDAYGQIFTSDKTIEKKKDIKRVHIEEDDNDLNIVDLTDQKTLIKPERFKQEVGQSVHRSTDEEEFVDDDPPEPKVYHDLPLPRATRNMTIFSEKGTFPTVTILPLENIERRYETQESRGPETDEESLTEAEEPLDMQTPTNIPNMDWEITTVRENSLDKTKDNFEFLEIEETSPKIHKRRKPPKFKYLYQQQLNRQKKLREEEARNDLEDVVIIEDDTEDQPNITSNDNDNSGDLLDEQVVSSDDDYGSPSRTPTPNPIKNSVLGKSNENGIGSSTPPPSSDEVMYLKGGYFPELKGEKWTTYFWIENYTDDNNRSEETELARRDQIKAGEVNTNDLTSKHRSGSKSYHSSFLVSPLSYFVSENQQTIVRNPFSKNNKNFETIENSGTIPKTTCTKQIPNIFESDNDNCDKQMNVSTATETVDLEQNVSLGNPFDTDDFISFNNDWMQDETDIENVKQVESNNNPFLQDANIFDVVDVRSTNKIKVESKNRLDSINYTKDASENFSFGIDTTENFHTVQNIEDQNTPLLEEKKSIFSIKEFAVEQTSPKRETPIETTTCQIENEISGENQFTSDFQINPSEDALINIPVKKKLKVPKQLFVSQQGNITDVQLNTVAREKFVIDFEGEEAVKDDCNSSEDLILSTSASTASQDVNRRFNNINAQPETSRIEVETMPKDISLNPHMFPYERHESVLLENKLDTIYENDSCDTSLTFISTIHNDNLSLSQDPDFYTETIKKILPGVELESPSLVVNVIRENVVDTKSPDFNKSATDIYFREVNDTIDEELKNTQPTEGDIQNPPGPDYFLLENPNVKTLCSTVPEYIISETAAQIEKNILLKDQPLLTESSFKALMTEFGAKSDHTTFSCESGSLLRFGENTDGILQIGDFIIAEELQSRESSNKLESPINEDIARVPNQASNKLSENFNVNNGEGESFYDGLKSEIKSNNASISQDISPQYVSYFKHKEQMKKPYEADDTNKNTPIISTTVKHELTAKSNIISLDHFEDANTSTLNLSPSTKVVIEVPVKRKLKIPKRTKLNVEDSPLGENFESGGALGPDPSSADEFTDRCRSSLHFTLETPVITHNTEQNITPECRSFLNLNPSAQVLIEVPVKRILSRPKHYTNYSEVFTSNEENLPEKQSVKSSEDDKPLLAENVNIDNNFCEELRPPSQSIWWEGAFRDLEIAKENGLAEQCEAIRQTEVIDYPKLSNVENLINFNYDQPKKNSKANVQLLIKPTNRNDPIEIQSVKSFFEKKTTPSKTNKKCFTLPHRSSRSEPFDGPERNSKGKRSLSVADLLLTSDSDDDSEESFRIGDIYTFPTIFSKSSKGSNKLLSVVQKAKYPLQYTDKSPFQRRKKSVPIKALEQSITPKLDSSTTPNNPGEHSSPPLTMSPVFHSRNDSHPDVYCDWISPKSDILNDDKTCQLTDELTATNTEQPLPKPRPSKLPEVGQTTGLPDIEPEKPLSPVRDDLLDREDVPETYNDKRKFWENVSQEHSQKRLSFQEPTTEKNVPRTRISVPDFSNMPVPKPRTVLQTSQSLVEADSKSEGAASCSYAESKGAISKRTEDDMFLDRKIKPAKKKSSIETDHKGSGQISEGLGYISDSEDVENNISDSEIEDRVPQIRDRMMSVFVPSGSSACRVMRSASLPTEDLYEVSARTIKARKEYYEEQIRKEMIEEQLTSEIEEEHSPERKNLLSSTEEDRTEADAKSIGEDMEDIKEDIRSSTKSHTSKIPIREPKVIQDVEEKLEEKFGATKKLEVKTKHKEDTHKIERKVTPTTKVEKISITTESTDSKQKSRKTQEDQPTPITEGSQISAKDNERSMLESQLNLSSGRSGPLVEETNLIGGSHSVKPHPPEVLVDKSEIEGSEKLTDLDQDTENRSVDLSGTEIIGNTGTNKLKYGEIKLVTATKTGCEIDISEQAEEFILPEIVAERIDFSSKAQGIKDANRVTDTKITHESSPGTIPKTDADKISREQQADEEKNVVVSSDKKGTSKKDIQNIDKTVVEIHQTRSTENKGKVKDRAEDDDKKEKPKELADVKTKDLDKTKPKPDTTKIKPSTEARPLIAEGQTNIEQLIYDCLQQQKVDSEEAHKIANALVGEIEAEIQKQDALDQPVEKITNLDDKKYIPENLKRLAEIKGLDAREIELVESVLERRQRSLKLTREDTQISSVEITDEDLKYSGGEFDYSQVLEQQVNQLKQESQSEILDETPDDVKSNAKSVDINSESTCKEKEWLRDNETIKGNKKTSVLESGTLKSTEAVSSEKLNMQDTTTFQIGDKEAKKVVDEKSKVVKSQAEVTIDEKTKVSTDESEITASNLDTTKVKSNHKTHILEDELKIKDKDNNIELIQAKAHNLNKDNIEIEHKLQQATTEITEDAVKRTEEKTEDKYNERSEQVEEVFRETSSKLEERDDGSTVKIHKEVDKVQSTTQNVVTKVYHEEKVSTSISQEVIKDKDKILGGMSENLDKHKTSFENQSEIFNAAQLPTETPASTTPAVVLRKSKSDADTSSGSSVAKVDRKSGYEYEVNSSSGESHYQSFEMESGKSRPCSSDIEGFVAVSSSEYESALTSQVYSARSQISSTDYQTPVSTLSSKESMKSLDSEGSDNLASVEVTEHSETLVPSTSDLEDMLDSADQQLLTDESEQNFNFGARCSEVPQVNEISDSEGFSYKNESIEVSDEESPEMKVAEVHSKMKRSYEMTFQPEPKVLTQESPQGEQDEKLRTSLDEGSIFSTSMSSTSSIGTQRTVIDCDRISTGTSEHVSLEELENAPKGNLENLTITTDMFTSTAEVNTGMLIESVTLTTSSVDINGVQSVCTQVTSDEHAVADEVTSLTFTEPKKKGHKRNESVLMGSKIILPAQFEEEKVSFETPKVSESITQEKTIEPLEKVVEKAVDKTNKLWKIDDEDILHEKYFAVKTGEFLESERAAAGDCYVINKFHDAKPEKLENVPEEPSPSPRQSAYVPHFDTPQPLDEVSQSAEQINQSDSTKKEIVATIVTKEQQNLEKSLPQNESIHKFLEKEREISERYHVLEQVANKKAAKLTEGKPVDTTNKTVASNQISSSEISEFLEKERSLAEKYESPLAEIKQITKTKAQPSTSKPTPVVKKVDNHSIAEFLDKEREIGEEYKPTAQTIYIEQAKVKVSSEIPENKLISKESSTSAVKGNAVDVGAPVKISSPSISQFLEKEREASKQFKSAQESIYKENEFEKQAPTDRRVNKDKPHAEIIPDVDMQKFLDHEREACDVNKLVDSNKPKNDPFKKLNEKSIKEATTSSIAQEIYKKSDKIISNEFHKQPEGKVVFSKVPPCLSPAHKANQICPIMEDDISEKHELEKQETMKKKLEEKRKEIIEDYNVPDITVTQHMAPLVDNDFRYPDLELEAKEKLAGSQETPQTPASNSSKSSEETDIEQEYIVTEPVETISEEPEDRSPESKTEIKSVVETKTDEVLEKETDSLGSSESFEMLDKPDIIDDFVVIEEIGKEADELDAEGKSVKIAKVQKHKKKQDQEEDEERYLAHSAPTPLTTTKISDVKYFPEDDFEDSPPQVQGSKNGAYSTRDYIDRELEANRKWVEQQFQGDHASIMAAGYGYEMEFERGPLEDIKEEDITDFAASSYGSQKDSGGSLKESYSSTPEYDVLAGRKYFTRSGEHDDASMSSLQEFEKLEQAMSLEMRKLHQGSQDSSSNGSFKTKYVLSKGAHGSDISVSSLKEFEGLEKACIAAHTIEVQVKEEEALLDHIEEGQESIASESEGCETVSKNEKKLVTDTEEEGDYEKRMFEIDEIIKQAQTNVERFIDLKDIEQTESLGRGDSIEEVSKVPDLDLDAPLLKSTVKVQWKENGDVMLNSTDSLEAQVTKPPHHQSVDSLDQELIGAVKSSSSDSIEMEAKKFSKDSLDVHGSDKTYMVSSDSLETGAPMQSVDPNVMTSDSIDEDSSRFGIYDHSHSSTGRDLNSSAKEELSHERDGDNLVESRDNLDISSSTATHATYQYESDSVFSGSFTSGGSNTMVSSTNSIDQGKQVTAVDLEAAARQVWFEESEGKYLEDSKPYVTEIIEPCEDEFFTHTINRTVELPAEIRKVTITGPDADLKMKQFIQDFEEGEECVETQEVDADGNVHIRRVVKRRFVVKDDSGQLPTSEIEKYFKDLQPDSFKGKEFDSSAPSSSKISKVTRDVQEVSVSKGDQPAPSTKATRRRPLRYEISVEDQTEVDPREHDWRFNLPKHAEGEEDYTETEERKPSH